MLYLDILPIDVILKIQPHLNFKDIKNLTEVSDAWNFVAENEATWSRVKRQYLSSFRNVDSNFMSRMNLLDIDHYSAEIDRLHDTPDSMETTRFFTKVRSFVGRYFGTRDRLVIFGPGMEMGFVKFFMWNCEDIGLKTEVEMPIQGSREMQVNLLSICYNSIKYELQSLYPAPKAVRDQEHRSLLTPEGRLIGGVQRRCREAKKLIFCISAHKPVLESHFKELDLILRESAELPKLLILAMDNGQTDITTVLDQLPENAKSIEYRLSKISVEQDTTTKENERSRYLYDKSDLASALKWLLDS